MLKSKSKRGKSAKSYFKIDIILNREFNSSTKLTVRII